MRCLQSNGKNTSDKENKMDYGSPEYERKQENLIKARKQFNAAVIKRTQWLPNGNALVDGKEMKRSVFMNKYKYSDIVPGPKTIRISSNPDRTPKPTTKQGVKADKKAAQLNAKILKKVDKANYSPNATAARKIAAARAEKVDPKNRTLAQDRAIRTASRYKVGLPGFSKGPISAETKKADKQFDKETKIVRKNVTAKYKAQVKATKAAQKTAQKATGKPTSITKRFGTNTRGRGRGMGGMLGNIENR
jgi:hypothetical protein